MYPAIHAAERRERTAFIMAASGETMSYGELDARSNRLAHLLRARGLKRLDHYAVFMENNAAYLPANAAGERAGLYFTCVNSYLTAHELAYIINNSESQALITSRAQRDVAAEALEACPNVRVRLIVDAPSDAVFTNLDEACGGFPETPIADEWLGTSMLYSSGTTGRPKGVLRPLPPNPPHEPLPLFHFLTKLWHYRDDMIYLSPAPLYHAAPQAAVGCAIRRGATAIIMEHFDPEQFLALVEKHRVTHSQLVPTMFNRLLKLPSEVRRRYDLSSLEVVVHAAAPCPVQIKEQMIEWWGPIIHEYYGATEGLGFTACDSPEWLAHRGTVGKVMLGDLHILDAGMQPAAKGVPGEIWFKTASAFEYFNDPQRTAQSRSADGTMTTVGDVGFVDDDGFLYLTDRSTFMIISGGVNIYPQECENLLVTHAKVADAAVFGVPNSDLGEEVKALVQLIPGEVPGADLEAELMAFCQQHLARYKCPRSLEFDPALPRLPTGKLYKKALRDRYWSGKTSRIV
jgi:long-chain acyl-CoA synthetase